MADYTNELYMQLERANRTANYAISTGVRSILLLIQYLKRMEKEGLLKGGEVASMEAFLTVTEGRYDIMNIPYTEADALQSGKIRPGAMERIKGSLDASGIRYCFLPDLNPGDHRVQVAVYTPDAQKFSAFYTAYLRGFLSGGRKEFSDLMNFTNGAASIVSMPDEAKEAMEGALTRLSVDYAPLPDLNLKDGEFQISVANHQTDTVLRAYKLYQEGLLSGGTRVSDARVMSEKDYRETAVLSADDYAASADPALSEKMKAYEKDTEPEKRRIIEAADSQVKEPDRYSFSSHLDSGEYTGVSVDEKTLVEESSASVMAERYPGLFFCRIPGTYGEGEKLLAVPKLHVFRVDDAERKRYLVFIKKNLPPSVLNRDGVFRDVDPAFPTAKSVAARFDKTDLEKVAKKGVKSLAPVVPIPPPVK